MTLPSGSRSGIAAADGRWNIKLAELAMEAELGKPPGPLSEFKDMNTVRPVHVILVKYKDGTKATLVRIGSSSTRWAFACKLAGEPRVRATSYYVGPWGNRCLFMALAHAIQDHFVNRFAPYPVERTLLTTGVLEAAMRSRADRAVTATPHLNIAYPARDFRAFRELGASWKILGARAEPKGLGLLGDK